MNAYMVESNTSIEPFGDHPRDCLIGNRKLGAIQKEVLQSLALAPKAVSSAQHVEDPNEYIIFEDDIFFTKELLQAFVAKSRMLKQATICSVKPPAPGPYLYGMPATQNVQAYPERVEYALRYMPSMPLRGKPVPLLVDVEQHFGSAPLPQHMFRCLEYRLPMTDRILIQIAHWANIHNANLAVAAAVPARFLNSKARILGAAIRACSLNQWKLGHYANKIGKNCDIHPTAWVEFSSLGNNVRVGAGSVITASMAGDGAVIGNNVTMEFSVAGDRSYIASGSMVRHSLLYPGVFTITRLINYSVCGRDAFLGDAVTLSDFRLDGRNVSVMKNGHSVDTGSPLIGACLGHGVYLGAGCIVGPGRAIPNGTRLSPERSRHIVAFGADGSLPGYRLIGVTQDSKPKIETVEKKRPRVPLFRRLLKLPSID